MSSNGALAVPEPERLLVITGPTAVGKSEVALEVAVKARGEIVSADSMQIYRGLDRGTAKPSAQDRARVAHHLVDVVEPDRTFSVAEYQSLAREAVAAINRRGKLPLLVGGTGLYISAVVDYAEFPPVPPRPALRRRLAAIAAARGAAALHRCLAARDPEAATRIHPHDARRLIRALEVLSQGGTLRMDGKPPPAYDLLMFGLSRPRAELYRRIEARVEQMFREGLVEEVAALRARGLGRRHQSLQALGYKEVLGYLAGEYDLDQALYLVKRNTRRYAKRQLTWLCRDARITWITLGEDMTAAGAAAAILERVAERWEGVVE